MTLPLDPLDADDAAGALWRIHLPAVTVEDLRNDDAHMLIWQVRGESDFALDGEPLTLSEAHALWIPAGLVHTHTVREDSVMLPLLFPATALATTLQRATVIRVAGELRTLLLACYQSQVSLVKPDIDLRRQVLAMIEYRPTFASALPLPVTVSALRIAELLRVNPGDTRSVDDLSAAVHASYSTVKRAFRAETGMSLHRWRIANRMETAAALLHSTTSIPAVAARVGYVNVVAFTRVFAAHFGVTPTQYIRQNASRARSSMRESLAAAPGPGGPGAGERGHVHIPPVMSPPTLVWDDRHTLLWQTRGSSDLTTDAEERVLRAGQAVWIPAEVRHSHAQHADSVVLPMHFEVATTATTLREVTVVEVDRDLRTLLLAHLQQGSFLSRSSVSVSRQILSLIESEPLLVGTLPMPTSDAALTVAEALRFDPGDDRSIDELAAAANVSRSTIKRAFPAETGMTLRHWRTQNRMKSAGILLRSRANVAAVAARVGYASHSAFGRVFKSHFGMTPSEYVDRYGVP